MKTNGWSHFFFLLVGINTQKLNLIGSVTLKVHYFTNKYRLVKIEKGKEDNVICLVENSHIAEVRTHLFLPYNYPPPLSYYCFTFRLFQNGGHRCHPAMSAKIIVHGGVYHRGDPGNQTKISSDGGGGRWNSRSHLFL